MNRNVIFTKKKMPVRTSSTTSIRPFIADATITQTAHPSRVEVKVIVEGENAQMLGDFVASSEIIGFFFEAVPAVPTNNKE